MSAADPERRNTQTLADAARRTEPQLPWTAETAPQAARPAPTAEGKASFESDAPAAPDKAGFAAPTQTLLKRLADLLRRSDSPTPFAIGLFAPAGAGKTSALNWLADNLKASGSPLVVAVRAADLAAAPERALAAALYRALSPRHGALAQEAAQEGAHFGADPGALARSAQDRLEALRRKLTAEKQALAQTETRRAALKETLLYETPGSRVDSYARKMRNAFEHRLRRFGFSGESLSVFKDLTRDVNESGGMIGRLLTSLRALYAYRGQTRLLVLAALSFGVNQGFTWLAANKPAVLGIFSSAGSIGVQTADFLQDKLDWLPLAARIFALIALALLGLNLWRAFEFMQPLVRAARLLDEDVLARRHEIDQTLAHQARTVEMMGSDADALARKAAEAERRAAAVGASKNPPLFLESDDAAQKSDYARGFLESLSELLTRGAISGAPRRLVVAVDGFESVEAPAGLFGRVNDLLARPGLIAIYALDPRLFPTASDDFARRIQLPMRLDADSHADLPALAPLDTPLSPLEARLVGALAPLAGDNPRAQKRLRNQFRFLRPAPGAPSGLTAALALFLAADVGASPADRQALQRALIENGDFAPRGSAALHEALANATAIDGPISREDARRAAALARQVSVASAE